VAETAKAPLGVDVTTPNVARMYDYYLGGKDNFEADRIAAKKILRLIPGLPRSAQENRKFLRRVVRFLTDEAGIDQFLDVGVGLPTQGAVHQVAHEINPDARVLYVDYDPVVVRHGQALLKAGDRSVMVQGDLRRPAELLAHPHLDLGRPVAVLLSAVMHFVSDDEDPAGIVASLRDGVLPGSYLMLSHIGTDFFPDKTALAQAIAIYEQASERVWPRPRDQVLRFFDGWEILEPGLVPKHEWRPPVGTAANGTPNIQWGAVARKP
jgi:hypothetical protein